MANSVYPDQTAPVGAVCPGTTLFILNSSVMLGNYLQQTIFLGALRVNTNSRGPNTSLLVNSSS